SFAAGVGSGANASRLDPSQSYAANANNLNLPRGVVSGGLVILLRAQFGNPIQGAKATHFFGDVIAQPQQDEYGVDLALPNNGVNPPRLPVLPADYWVAEPFTTTSHTNAGYYWSPHAERVYATETGPTTVVWRKAAPSLPSGSPLNVSTTQIAGVTYTIFTNRYLVSTVATKTPRRMYWTEGQFTPISKTVSIPVGLVKDVNIVYNNHFPRYTNEFLFNGTPAGPVEITNTL